MAGGPAWGTYTPLKGGVHAHPLPGLPPVRLVHGDGFSNPMTKTTTLTTYGN